MTMQVALAGAIAESGRQPEIVCRARRRGPRARDRDVEQGIDASTLVVVVFERSGPPDVSARLERHGGGVGGVARAELGEVQGGAGEPAGVECVETGPQVRSLDARVLQ